MRALVTRPREDAEGVAAALRKRGIEVQIEPMIEIVPVPDARVVFAGVQAVLATSANGVRALAAASAERAVPLLAVGDATARAARAAGFSDVDSAGGDVETLAALARRRLDPGNGALLHVAGSVVAGDLTGVLKAAGFEIRRAVLYRAETRTEVSPTLDRALRDDLIDLSLFFSPRTAATFVTLVRRAGLDAACRRIVAVALSGAVAEDLAGLPWRAVRVAERPEQAAMLAVIDHELEGGR